MSGVECASILSPEPRQHRLPDGVSGGPGFLRRRRQLRNFVAVALLALLASRPHAHARKHSRRAKD
jgi:hypothetical protein